jgi:molybdopterin-guanine dinucleotide biosynthesis protein MobB
MRQPPMVAVIGKKHSGKTTLTVRLAAELHRRGHRVMTIKHGSHTFNIDPATTDTYRHYHEGNAERVAMVSPDKFALIVRWSDEEDPEAIAARHMSDAGIVLCEGFKRSNLPKIEVFRRAAHEAPLYDPADPASKHYLAVVADGPVANAMVPVIRLDDASWLDALSELVERRIMMADTTRRTRGPTVS